jgi:protein-tyrosine phosphatase
MALTCAPNFRDLGGLPARDGRRIAPGRLFRSEALPAPGAVDAAVLDRHGMRLVCDLRSARERGEAPNAFWVDRGVELIELDIAADIRGTAHWDAMVVDPGEAGAVELMRLTYRALPDAAAPHLRRLFDRIDAGDTPLMVHCTAGKDRTGVVVALLLSALGTPREAIYADYLETENRPNPAVVEATRRIMTHGLGRPVEAGALAALCGVRSAYLDESFAAIASGYGSLERYLEAAGLDAAKARRIQDRLLI